MAQKDNEKGLCVIDADQAAEMFYDGFTIIVDDNKELSLTDNPNMTEFVWNAHNYFATADAIMAEFELNSFIDNLAELEFDAKTDNNNNASLEDYAADFFEDACLDGDYHSQYKWRDGYTTEQNIAQSVMSGKTEYIDGYLNDMLKTGVFHERAAELLNELEDVKPFTKFVKSESVNKDVAFSAQRIMRAVAAKSATGCCRPKATGDKFAVKDKKPVENERG